MKIQDQIYQSISVLEESANQLKWEDQELYKLYLSQTYYYVRYITRIIARAASHCTPEQTALFKMLTHGLQEEADHDQLALRDLQHLNSQPESFPELSATTQYYQSLFKAIEEDGPAALLGFSVTLEGLGAEGAHQILNRVQEAHGTKCSQFLSIHIDADQDHFRDGMLSLSTLTPQELEVTNKYIKISTGLFLEFIKNIDAYWKETQRTQHQAS
jgi:thiaminase